MEVNLDDKYYQKYIEYKQKYLMLKQLKNNNDLEGGGVFDSIFGKKKDPIETTQSINTDGEYLVFYLDEAEQDLKKYYRYINDKSLDKNLFNSTFFEKAYIVTKKNNSFICKLITNEKNKDITKILDKLNNQLLLGTTISENKILNAWKTDNKKNIDYVNKILTITVNNGEINKKLNETKIEFTQIMDTINEAIDKKYENLNTSVQNIYKMPEFLRYKDIIITDYNLPFNSLNHIDFLSKIPNSNTDSKNAFNMILKITQDKDKYYLAYTHNTMNRDSMQWTSMYSKISAHKGTSEVVPSKNSSEEPK
jgi:hypothetical protein